MATTKTVPLFDLKTLAKRRVKARPPAAVADPVEEDAKEEGGREQGREPKKMLWVGAAVAGLAVLVVLARMLRARPVPVSNADSERYEAEKRVYEGKRMQLRSEYEKLMRQRADLQGRLRNNWERSQRNHEGFKTMFATSKASYDDDISGFEEEQKLETAFLLKQDIDDKKQEMIRAGEALGKEREDLVGALRHTDALLGQTIGVYNQSFDDRLEDPRSPQQEPGPAVPPLQQQAAAALRQQDAFMRDGTGREQMPV